MCMGRPSDYTQHASNQDRKGRWAIAKVHEAKSDHSCRCILVGKHVSHQVKNATWFREDGIGTFMPGPCF